jgi:hypothetical protein
MTDTTPAEREAFEAWVRRTFVTESRMLAPGQGRWPYAEQTTLFMWQAWQARAASQPAQEPVSDSEMAAIDSVIYGGCVTLDGKRIDPTSVYAAPPADDEAVRLLHHVRMVLPNDRWADDTKRAIDAYLAKVNK